MARLKQAALEAGLPFGDRKMTYNSRLAQELSKWAASRGMEAPFHRAVFEAYFVKGINIGKIAELSRLAGSIGLPGSEAEEILQKRTFKEAVDADWIRSRQMGIQAVPTLILDRYCLVGAQPYGKMAEFLETAGVRKKEGRT